MSDEIRDASIAVAKSREAVKLAEEKLRKAQETFDQDLKALEEAVRFEGVDIRQ